MTDASCPSQSKIEIQEAISKVRGELSRVDPKIDAFGRRMIHS